MKQTQEYTGLVEIRSGWGEEATVDRDRLIEMLQSVPKGDIRISMVPHEHGRALIAKPRDSTSALWYALAPMKPKRGMVPGGEQ